MQKLKICFTSDLHGYFYPTSYGDMAKKEMGLFRCFEGFQKDENTLVIDGGDNLQGSAFAYYCMKVQKSNKVIADIMNSCGYDYVTVGNHDFNYGMSYLKEYVSHLSATCLCENLKDEQGNSLYPFVVKELPNGLRVALIGIVTDYVNVWEKEENLAGVAITDPFEAAKCALAACKEQVDITVGIYHGGFENDLKSGEKLSTTTENIAYRICKELEFDLLLTGHQHMSVDGQYVHDTYVVQPCEYGREFQKVEIEVVNGRKTITSKRIKATYQEDAYLSSSFSTIENAVQTWLNQPIGRLSQSLCKDDKVTMAYQGSPIADFLNAVQLYFSGAQISSIGLANEIAGFHKEVTTRDILATYPYPNTLVVLEISGSDLLMAMERSAEYFCVDENGKLGIASSFLVPKVEHYNYDFYAGIEYEIQPENPVGKRIVCAQYKGRRIHAGDMYTICINNYRHSGAGGYSMYPNCKVVKEINTEMVELIMEYFQIHKEVQVESLFNTGMEE